MELNGKVALVLGGIKGIGKGIALSLANAGVKVALTYFDWEEELSMLQKDLTAAGSRLIQQSGDACDLIAPPDEGGSQHARPLPGSDHR